ncbi:MAG: hypothetical protein QXY88_02410, partial [Candidatus Bathyarchaeia archaeon]
ETIYSDLILLVVDVSEPLSAVEKKLSVCLETIERIEASSIPIITALNKIDLLSEMEVQQKKEKLEGKAPNPVPISALYKLNIDQLKEEIAKKLRNYVQASFSIPLTDEVMPFLSWLFNRADVQEIKYVDNVAHVVFEAVPWFAEKVKSRVEALGGKIESFKH